MAKVEEKPTQAAPAAEEKKEEPKKKEFPVTYTQSSYDTCGVPPENTRAIFWISRTFSAEIFSIFSAISSGNGSRPKSCAIDVEYALVY